VEDVTMAILVGFSSFISSSSSSVNRDGSATTEEDEDLLLCFVRRGFFSVVKSYLLLPVDVKGGGFPEALLLRMPLLDLPPPPPRTLESKPRKKTEQSGEEVLIYVCVYLLLKYLLRLNVVTSSLSLSEAFSLKKRIEETKKIV
jgi:hypothetical protein